MKTQQQGFTLVELIVVIVILGILAATALPRFINVTDQARAAAVQGLAGGLRSAISVGQAAWQATGATGTSAPMVGAIIDVMAGTGVPQNTLAGIVRAMGCAAAADCQGVAVTALGTPGTSTWTPPNAGACNVTYNDNGTVTVVGLPTC